MRDSRVYICVHSLQCVFHNSSALITALDGCYMHIIYNICIVVADYSLFSIHLVYAL